MLVDATAQMKESAKITEAFMKRVAGDVSSIVKIETRNHQLTFVVDRNKVNLSAVKQQGVRVIYCCMHDAQRVLEDLKHFSKDNNCFGESINSDLPTKLSNVLTATSYKLIESFLEIASQMDEIESKLRNGSYKIGKTTMKVITVMASLARCIKLFQDKLNPEKLKAEQDILKNHSELNGIQRILESTKQHLDLSEHTGIRHCIIDLTIVQDYVVRSITKNSCELMQTAENFCSIIIDIAKNGSADLVKGRFGAAISTMVPLPAHYQKKHFTHLKGIDIIHKLDFKSETTEKEKITIICKTISNQAVYIKDDVILKLKDSVMNEIIFHKK